MVFCLITLITLTRRLTSGYVHVFKHVDNDSRFDLIDRTAGS
jgi:hypothetical protein